MALPSPSPIECYLHDINVLSDAEIEAKYYTSGIAIARYPVPAILTPTFDSLFELGSITAENGWPVEAVFDLIPITRRR